MISDLDMMTFLTEVLNFTNMSKTDFLIDLAEVIYTMSEDIKKAERLTVILKRVIAERISESDRL